MYRRWRKGPKSQKTISPWYHSSTTCYDFSTLLTVVFYLNLYLILIHWNFSIRFGIILWDSCLSILCWSHSLWPASLADNTERRANALGIDYTFCTYFKLDFLFAGCHTSFSYITQLHNTDLLAVLFIRISWILLPHFLYPTELHTVSFTPTPCPSLSYY